MLSGSAHVYGALAGDTDTANVAAGGSAAQAASPEAVEAGGKLDLSSFTCCHGINLVLLWAYVGAVNGWKPAAPQ